MISGVCVCVDVARVVERTSGAHNANRREYLVCVRVCVWVCACVCLVVFL